MGNHNDELNLTRAQVRGVYRKFLQDPDGALDFMDFLDRVHGHGGLDDCVSFKWCGMYVGVETDGYTHT